MTVITKKRNCADCNLEFDAQDIEWEGSKVFCQQRCDSCLAVAQKTSEEREKARKDEENTKANKEAFEAICPPLYRATNPSQLHPKFYQAAMNWQYGPKGLGLVGISGKGKTRAAYLLLQRMLALGRNVQATAAITFAKLCVDQFADDKARKLAAEREIKSIYQADVWFLDDLGKQRMTERGETELYAALEHRTVQTLPTIWTANAKSDVLMQMFSEDRGDPIMRRLTEFSEIVAVWNDDVRTTQYK